MPNVESCSNRDFSAYDAMSTEQLQQFLREDAFKTEAEGSDTAAVLYVMDLLAARRRERSGARSAQDAWRSFKENYNTQKIIISEAEKKGSKKHTHTVWKRGLAAAGILAVLLVGSTVTARAFGVDLWQLAVKWTEEAFVFSAAEEHPELETVQKGSEVCDGLRGLLGANGIYDLKLPNWLPEGFTEGELEVIPKPDGRQFCGVYTKEDEILQIVIIEYNPSMMIHFEQSNDCLEIYTLAGMDYYLFKNNSRWQAVWLADSYLCSISGPASRTQMKMIIDSIEEG